MFVRIVPTSFLHRRPQVLGSIGATTIVTRGAVKQCIPFMQLIDPSFQIDWEKRTRRLGLDSGLNLNVPISGKPISESPAKDIHLNTS